MSQSCTFGASGHGNLPLQDEESCTVGIYYKEKRGGVSVATFKSRVSEVQNRRQSDKKRQDGS